MTLQLSHALLVYDRLCKATCDDNRGSCETLAIGTTLGAGLLFFCACALLVSVLILIPEPIRDRPRVTRDDPLLQKDDTDTEDERHHPQHLEPKKPTIRKMSIFGEKDRLLKMCSGETWG